MRCVNFWRASDYLVNHSRFHESQKHLLRFTLLLVLVSISSHIRPNLNDVSAEIKSEDAVYVLAYSVIMLNTDLHNPQIRVS